MVLANKKHHMTIPTEILRVGKRNVVWSFDNLGLNMVNKFKGVFLCRDKFEGECKDEFV